MQEKKDTIHLPTSDNSIRKHAPNWTTLRLPILVTTMVWTIFFKVVDPVPVPQRPAKTLERPSSPITRLRILGVGGRDATNKEDAWYEPDIEFKTKWISSTTRTSAVRAFCPGYFPHFVSGLEPRHIGVRPKGTLLASVVTRSHRVPFMPRF